MKPIFRLAIYLLFPVLFWNCSSTKISNTHSQQSLTYTKDSLLIHPQIRGIWKSIGNGYYLEAREDSILLYSYTASYCYKEKNDYLEGLLNNQSQFLLNGDTMSIYLTDYGEATPLLQAKKDFVKVNELPSYTLTFSEMTQLSAENQLELYKETLEENYAFHGRRNLDWEEIFISYRDSLSEEEASLFETMGKIATLTKDQHTKVISTDGQKRQYTVTPSALDVQAAFEEQTEIKDLNEYFNFFFQTNASNISDSLLGGKGKKILNGNIEWGLINEKVGYINIRAFSGFLNREYTRKQQIDTLKKHMNHIIGSFQHTHGIIIDLSFNFGGYDASALTIASYFTDKPIKAFSSQVYDQGDFYEEDEIFVYPADSIVYDKPVYVLTTDISRSAAEGFGMMMDALPNVQIVGTNTLGILSGMLGKSISTFYTTYSNQRLVNPEGEFFEVSGLEPDIVLSVFPQDNVLNGHFEAVKKIVAIIE